jgi:hypothetical protein
VLFTLYLEFSLHYKVKSIDNNSFPPADHFDTYSWNYPT